jgi:hypothetical protein
MATYAIEYADGAVTEVVADTDAEAVRSARGRFSDETFFARYWEDDGVNNQGELCRRISVWSSKEDAANGVKAVAKLTSAGK